jgi:hypothetical protein
MGNVWGEEGWERIDFEKINWETILEEVIGDT